jgi:hypothetical protein
MGVPSRRGYRRNRLLGLRRDDPRAEVLSDVLNVIATVGPRGARVIGSPADTDCLTCWGESAYNRSCSAAKRLAAAREGTPALR